jgi:hypothetical protein
MMRISSLLLVFFSIALMNSGCQKEDMIGKDIHSGCLPEVFSVPSWYSDSIFYANNKISRINKSYRLSPEKNTYARIEYSNDEVKISVRDFVEGSWRDFIYYTLSYQNSKISQVTTNSGQVQANYFYNNNNLSYILYHSGNGLTDSISVEYDSAGNNIALAKWYKFDRTAKEFHLANTAVYSYDEKINPHRNSIHFLYDFYDAKEYSLDYFNKNNIKTIKSTLIDIRTEYTYSEYDYPTYVIFYDSQDEEKDRNSIIYSCN